MQKLCLAWDEALKKLRASLARHDICRRFNPESYVAIVSSESFADSSRAGIIEWHYAVYAEALWQSSVHLAEYAAPSGSDRMEFSINFGIRN